MKYIHSESFLVFQTLNLTSLCLWLSLRKSQQFVSSLRITVHGSSAKWEVEGSWVVEVEVVVVVVVWKLNNDSFIFWLLVLSVQVIAWQTKTRRVSLKHTSAIVKPQGYLGHAILGTDTAGSTCIYVGSKQYRGSGCLWTDVVMTIWRPTFFRKKGMFCQRLPWNTPLRLPFNSTTYYLPWSCHSFSLLNNPSNHWGQHSWRQKTLKLCECIFILIHRAC